MRAGRIRVLAAALSVAALAAAMFPGAAPAQSTRRSRATPRGALRADTFWSQSLGTHKRLISYLPPSYSRDTTRRFPVLYYLHGLSGSEEDWLREARIDQVMDSLVATGNAEAIVVMPDGDDSWYTTWHSLPNLAGCRADTTRTEPDDTFCVPWPHYDDYIARDLVAFVDSSLRTLADAAHRGIAGLSMGGYGAITLALRFPDVYAAAASHSGVLAPPLLAPHPYPFPFTGAVPTQWARTPDELRTAAGSRYHWFAEPFGPDTIGWYARDPSHLVARLVTHGTAVPALFMDVGATDPFRDQNRAFVATLSSLGLSHRYLEPTGGHTWTYWRAQLPQSLRWMLEHVAPRDTGAVTPRDPPPDGVPQESA